MSTPDLPDYTAPFKPVPMVTPFTIRDNDTMLKKVEYINKYIRRILIPWINENFSELADAFEEQVNILIEEVNTALATQSAEVDAKIAQLETDVATAVDNVNAALAAQTAYVDGEITDLTAYVDAQVQLIINDSIQVQDPVVAAAMADTTKLSYQQLDARVVTGLVAGTGAEEANRTIIQGMLDSIFSKRVSVPEGEWYVGYLNVPAGKELTGVFARAYTTVPTTGTRLRASTAAQTTPVITLGYRTKLNNIAVVGAGMATAQHPCVQLSSGGAVIENCMLMFGTDGIDGNYKLAIITNNAITQNRSTGIRDLLDGQITMNTINANDGRGIYYGAGAGSGHIVANRIEWNNGAGIELYQCGTVAVSGNFIDRNGLAGIRAISTLRVAITGNTIRRNGRLASGITADDCNLYLASNTDLSITGNVTAAGDDDDDGGGYFSPLNCIRTQSNVSVIIIGNALRGATGASISAVSGAGDTKQVRFGNILLDGSTIERIDAIRAQLGSATGNVATTATGAYVFPGDILSTNSVGRIYDIDINSRDASTTTVKSATLKALVRRSSSADASIVLYAPTNLSGTDFALTGGVFNITATVSADGGTITINIENTSANTQNFHVRVK